MSEKELLNFFIKIGIIKPLESCPRCIKPIEKIYYDKKSPYKRCNDRNCNRPKNFIINDTIFQNHQMSLKIYLRIIIAFAYRRTLGDLEQTLQIRAKTLRYLNELLRKLL